MIPFYNAFLPGELAMIADEDHLKAVLAAYRNGVEVLETLRPHIGKQFRIVSCSFPQVCGVHYELSGIEGGIWQECLIDWAIDDEDEGRVLASKIYTASAVFDGDDTFIVITDRTGKVFAKFRRLSPENAIAQITEIASLRNRAAFEARFGFESGKINPHSMVWTNPQRMVWTSAR
jgi:hypothetical protein